MGGAWLILVTENKFLQAGILERVLEWFDAFDNMNWDLVIFVSSEKRSSDRSALARIRSFQQCKMQRFVSSFARLVLVLHGE